MRKQRSFSSDFKRQVVEEYLSGVSTAVQLCRRHGILYHWKKQYVKNSFESDASREAALEERINQLEQTLGKAHLENEFLKKRSIGVSNSPRKKAVHYRPPRPYRNRHEEVQTHEPPSKQLLLQAQDPGTYAEIRPWRN